MGKLHGIELGYENILDINFFKGWNRSKMRRMWVKRR